MPAANAKRSHKATNRTNHGLMELPLIALTPRFSNQSARYYSLFLLSFSGPTGIYSALILFFGEMTHKLYTPALGQCKATRGGVRSQAVEVQEERGRSRPTTNRPARTSLGLHDLPQQFCQGSRPLGRKQSRGRNSQLSGSVRSSMGTSLLLNATLLVP